MGRTRTGEPPLTSRQREVLDLLARGHTNGEIAEALGISLDGAKWHVSELLDRFAVTSRDELVDAWQAERRPVARLGRWLAGAAALTSLTSLKPVAAASAVVAVVGVAGVAVGTVAIATRAATEGPGDATPSAIAWQLTTATPQVSPSSVPPLPHATLPAAPAGATWSPSDAYRAAETRAIELLAHPDIAAHYITPVTFLQLTLVEVRWLPAIINYDSADGASRWAAPNDDRHNAWLFRWRLDGVDARWPAGFAAAPLSVEVELLLEDGRAEPTLAERASLFLTPDPAITLGPNNGWVPRGVFESAARSERERTMLTDPIPFGWLNNVPGMGAYQSAYGNWCVGYFTAGTTRLTNHTCPDPAELRGSSGAATTVSADGTIVGPYTLDLRLPPGAVLVEVTTGGGPTLSFDTVAAPPASGIRLRFAYIALDTIGDSVEMAAYDAAGNVVWDQVNQRPGPPPPPPPGATSTP
ncbi:MAG: helix-turn-helix transcriptional regulator [Dehalococcoidia bacterium]|nr:helix-turn-helix transcriptional regulator [Dehalococcoidia bacterium]